MTIQFHSNPTSPQSYSWRARWGGNIVVQGRWFKAKSSAIRAFNLFRDRLVQGRFNFQDLVEDGRTHRCPKD